MIRKCALATASAMLIAPAALADSFPDNSGNHLGGGDLHDFFQNQGFDHLDILNVEITNDSQYIFVDITLGADLDATNWGKYALGIDTGNSAGVNGNGWGRNIDWARNTNFWVATWADDAGSGVGGQVWGYDDMGAVWNELGSSTSGDLIGDDSQHAAGHQIFQFDFSLLGIGIGDTIEFDVVSTGGGFDPGVDHLSRNDFATDDWGVTSIAGEFLSYTLIPAPSAAALFGLGGLVALRRRR